MISPNYIVAIVYLTLAAALSATLVEDAQAATELEQARFKARELAENVTWAVPQARAAQAPLAQAQTHPLGVQTLSVEKRENKNKRDSLRMNVFQYHYDLQQSRRLTMDTLSNTLVADSRVDSVHLPLNEAEVDFAITLAESQTALVQQLRDEQHRRGHAPFRQLSDLDVKASIYEPLDQTHPCHLQRCALLSLFDESRTVFATEPVINLQQMSVNTLDGS